jgi:hypothetical protein
VQRAARQAVLNGCHATAIDFRGSNGIVHDEIGTVNAVIIAKQVPLILASRYHLVPSSGVTAPTTMPAVSALIDIVTMRTALL